MNSIEELILCQICSRHPNCRYSSICFASNTIEDVFHCKQCEEECKKNVHNHVELFHLNHPVVQETPIQNWPVLSKAILIRIQNAFNLSLEDFIEENQISRKKVELLQKEIQLAYDRFSQQKQFRRIISQESALIEEKSKDIVEQIQFAKEKKLEIEKEFVDLLNEFEFNTTKLIQNQQQNKDFQENSINEIKKNLQITCYEIDNKNNQFDIEKINHINKELSQFSNLTSLIVNLIDWEDEIGDSLIQLLIDKVPCIQNLTNLNLSLTWKGVDCGKIKLLLDSFADLKTFTYFNIDIQSSYIRYKLKCQEINLPNNLIDSLQSLTSFNFNFSETHFLNNDMQHLVDFLVNLKNLTFLNFNLMKSRFSYKLIEPLAYELMHMKNLTYLSLNLAQNHFSSVIVEQLVSSLSSLQNLISLNLNMASTLLDQQGMTLILDKIACLENLTHFDLNLENNHFNNLNEEINIDCEGFKSVNLWKSLISLDLSISGSHTTCQGFKQLNFHLAHMKKLTRLYLNLGVSEYDDETIISLSDSLAQMINLTFLIFILWPGYLPYTEFQVVTPPKRMNQITYAGIKSLANSLARLQFLYNLELMLENNNIDCEGIKSLSDSIKCLQFLTRIEVDLCDNTYGEKTRNRFQHQIQLMKKLVHSLLYV